MKVALIIVNYNSGELIEKCLDAVHRQTRPPDRIIVVDNASTDDSMDRIRRRGGQVEVLLLGSNIGFAAANNRALERCGDCDWVALLNPDAFPEPGWLEALTDAAAERPGAGSFASCLVSDEDTSVLDGTGDALHVSGLVWRIGYGAARADREAVREVFSACAAAALYRYRAVFDLGGFDEDYFCFNEDVDLGFRLRLTGSRCWYIPEAVARHVGSFVTGRHSDFSLFYGHRNLVWTYLKNMPGALLARFVWQHILLNLVTAVGLTIRYRTTAVIRSKLAALGGVRRVLQQRRAIQARRSCSDDEILDVMTTGWWRCYFQRQYRD